MKINNLSVFLAAALLGTAAVASGAPENDAASRLVEDFVQGSLALSPVSATASGYHRHRGISLDDRLDDFSSAGVHAARLFDASIQRRIDRLSAATLDPEQRADLEIIRNAVGESELEWRQIQSYRHNPTLYVELVGNAVYSPYVLQYAPPAARFGHIIRRLALVPALLNQARRNLVDSPEIWNQVAREENDGNIQLIDKTLRAECPLPLQAKYAAAARTAIAALRDFNAWLAADLASKPADWRLGKERYARKFAYTLAIGKSPEELLADAEADLKRVKADMAAVAAPKSVEEALAEVGRDHATPATFIAAARSALTDATAFVKARDLLTLPSRSNLQVVETPVFMRGGYPVGGFNPAPPLEPELGAFYWVTPIPNDWPASRIDSKLREYNRAGMEHLTVHEAMPGHYVQAEYANDVAPRPRRLLRILYGNTPYVEGWAVYAQQLMAEQGYQAETPGYRLMLQKQMLRVLANTILDIRLQTMGMSDEDAMLLMTKDALQEQEEAREKLQRAKLSSCQLPSYYAGLNGWLAARERFKTKKGASFTVKEFNERALRESAVPLTVLQQLLE